MTPTPAALDPRLLIAVIAALAACLALAVIAAHAYRDEARRWRRIAGHRTRPLCTRTTADPWTTPS